MTLQHLQMNKTMKYVLRRVFKMFELVEIKNYDTYHSYGTDWHTDCHFKTNKKLNLYETIGELKKLGHEPAGALSLNKNVLKTVMF